MALLRRNSISQNSQKAKTASNAIRNGFYNFVTPKVQMSNSFIEDCKKIVALKEDTIKKQYAPGF
jgi:hypothetical protein